MAAGHSVVLLITLDGPNGHGQANEGESYDLMGNRGNTTSTEKDRADGIDEVVHGIDVSGEVRPVGHGADRCEQATQQEETDNEEPHDKDGLLKGFAVVGYDEPEGGEEQGEKHSQQID